jgi:hypothetical protein
MASNLLTINPSKIEFLLTGLPKQLSKISDAVYLVASDTSKSSVPPACNISVVFDSKMSV